MGIIADAHGRDLHYRRAPDFKRHKPDVVRPSANIAALGCWPQTGPSPPSVSQRMQVDAGRRELEKVERVIRARPTQANGGGSRCRVFQTNESGISRKFEE
jgi:hypothetical protein